ncbi:histidine phosphatase family protein [Arcobacter sp.]|uniref:histidine phosphatase family protein n=1 Tax=Arcobacter sp. TaxID=1872629 RepID=UPI003D0C1A34
MNNFFFIRHGKTFLNNHKRYTGLIDVSILESSWKDVIDSVNILKNRNITEIFSSPLFRALETAIIVNSQLNIKISVIKEFQERDFGILTGRKKLQYKKHFFKQGSHPYIYKKKIMYGLSKLKYKSNFIIIGHSGTYEYICQLLLGKINKINKIQNAQIIYFYKKENKWYIEKI